MPRGAKREAKWDDKREGKKEAEREAKRKEVVSPVYAKSRLKAQQTNELLKQFSLYFHKIWNPIIMQMCVFYFEFQNMIKQDKVNELNKQFRLRHLIWIKRFQSTEKKTEVPAPSGWYQAYGAPSQVMPAQQPGMPGQQSASYYANQGEQCMPGDTHY